MAINQGSAPSPAPVTSTLGLHKCHVQSTASVEFLIYTEIIPNPLFNTMQGLGGTDIFSFTVLDLVQQ